MEKLFDDTELVQNKRPTEITDQQLQLFYEKMATEIVDCGFSDSSVDIIIEDLYEINIHQTGFDIAKELEDWGDGEYSYNGDFIDFLNTMELGKKNILADNVMLWVKAHNIHSKLEISSRLRIVGKVRTNLPHDTNIYITRIDEVKALYYLSTDIQGGRSTALPFEEVELNFKVV